MICMYASLSFNSIGGNTRFPVFPVKRTTLLMIYLGHFMETCKLLFCSDSCDEMGILCCLINDAVLHMYRTNIFDITKDPAFEFRVTRKKKIKCDTGWNCSMGQAAQVYDGVW